jgi:hypothetical protein
LRDSLKPAIIDRRYSNGLHSPLTNSPAGARTDQVIF